MGSRRGSRGQLWETELCNKGSRDPWKGPLEDSCYSWGGSTGPCGGFKWSVKRYQGSLKSSRVPQKEVLVWSLMCSRDSSGASLKRFLELLRRFKGSFRRYHRSLRKYVPVILWRFQGPYKKYQISLSRPEWSSIGFQGSLKRILEMFPGSLRR